MESGTAMRKFAAVSGFALLAAGCAATGPNAPVVVDAPPPPAAPVFTVADFENKTVAEIDAVLGEPTLSRIEGAGEYRRYALRTCSLIIILYPDDNGASRVAHLDVTSLHSDADKPDLDACLADGPAT
ncbi:MAG: hypothetical protein R3C40_10375 [Parvularculaceae bacterium]